MRKQMKIDKRKVERSARKAKSPLHKYMTPGKAKPTKGNLTKENAALRAALKFCLDYLDELEDNLQRNDVDMMIDKCVAPSVIAERVRGMLP